jgi:hypothetical protein
MHAGLPLARSLRFSEHMNSFAGSSVGRIVRLQGATRAEARLAAAGFHIEPADTAERLARLDAMPPFKIVEQSRDEERVFAYADPLRCQCQYAGDAQQYAEYKQLRDRT